MTPLVASWASSPYRPVLLRPFRSDRIGCRARRMWPIWLIPPAVALAPGNVGALALLATRLDHRIHLVLAHGLVQGVESPFGTQTHSHRPTRPRVSRHSPTGHIKDAGQIHEPRQARSARATQLRIAWAVRSNSQANSSGVCPLRTNSTIWCRKPRGYGGLDFCIVDTSSPRGQVSTKSCQLQQSDPSPGVCHKCFADLWREGRSDRCVNERVPPTRYCCSREGTPPNNLVSSPSHSDGTKT